MRWGTLLGCLFVAGALAQEPAPAPGDEAPPNSTEPAPAAPPAEPAGPWRLNDALGLPDWLHVEGTNRARFGYVFNQFRAGNPGDNRALSLRSTARLELRFNPVILGAELQDSRVYGEDDDAPLNTGIVNAMELLQAYLKLDLKRFLPDGHSLFVRAGRLTVDMGSRRLQARNRFRNTINSFTGIEGRWSHTNGFVLHGLLALPIQRRPGDRESLEDNDIQLDREHEDIVNWALMVTTPRFSPHDLQVEAYAFGLHEQDSSARQTRNRELYTPGFRVFRKPARGEFDGQFEFAYQWGRARASGSPADTSRLQHRAFFVHATAAYTFDATWQPRLALQYDYASGDARPTDGDSGRFDTLFGARRFEHGPTGIFGAFARANIHSPGVRLELRPHDTVRTFLTYRAYWLAHKRDAWTTSGVRDPAGDSGRFVGHLIDFRLRWNVLPGNVLLEAGAAAVIRGKFAHEAPNANKGGEPAFVYGQVVFKW